MDRVKMEEERTEKLIEMKTKVNTIRDAMELIEILPQIKDLELDTLEVEAIFSNLMIKNQRSTMSSVKKQLIADKKEREIKRKDILALSKIELMNKYWVKVNSPACFIEKYNESEKKHKIYSRGDFMNHVLNRGYFRNKELIIEKPIDKNINLAKLFDNHEETLTVHSTTFAPHKITEEKETIVNGNYNIFTGWGVKPKEGNWDNIKDFLLNIICSGVQEHFDYLIKLLADSVQRPNRKLGICIALQGKQGIGKGTFVENLMGRIFKDAFYETSDIEKITGKFNAVMEGKLLVHLDEAVWSGNYQVKNKLKGLITSRKINIERKGLETYSIEDYTRFFISTNDEWVAPVEEGDRRYFVLQVSDERKQDITYFTNLSKIIAEENGETEAFVDFLSKVKTNDVELRKIPKSNSKEKQELCTIGIYEVLKDLFEDEGYTEHLREENKFVQITKDEFRNMGGVKTKNMSKTAISKKLIQIFPKGFSKDQKIRNTNIRSYTFFINEDLKEELKLIGIELELPK